MRAKIKSFLVKHPYIANGASLAVGAYAGPAGAEALAQIARYIGIV
jgi:hypothetical protein